MKKIITIFITVLLVMVCISANAGTFKIEEEELYDFYKACHADYVYWLGEPTVIDGILYSTEEYYSEAFECKPDEYWIVARRYEEYIEEQFPELHCIVECTPVGETNDGERLYCLTFHCCRNIGTEPYNTGFYTTFGYYDMAKLLVVIR